MAHVIEIPEELYSVLERNAQAHGIETEQYIRQRLQEALTEDEWSQRQAAVDRIMDFQQKMYEKYGVMGDSTQYVREDRDHNLP